MSIDTNTTRTSQPPALPTFIRNEDSAVQAQKVNGTTSRVSTPPPPPASKRTPLSNKTQTGHSDAVYGSEKPLFHPMGGLQRLGEQAPGNAVQAVQTHSSIMDWVMGESLATNRWSVGSMGYGIYAEGSSPLEGLLELVQSLTTTLTVWKGGGRDITTYRDDSGARYPLSDEEHWGQLLDWLYTTVLTVDLPKLNAAVQQFNGKVGITKFAIPAEILIYQSPRYDLGFWGESNLVSIRPLGQAKILLG